MYTKGKEKKREKILTDVITINLVEVRGFIGKIFHPFSSTLCFIPLLKIFRLKCVKVLMVTWLDNIQVVE